MQGFLLAKRVSTSLRWSWLACLLHHRGCVVFPFGVVVLGIVNYPHPFQHHVGTAQSRLWWKNTLSPPTSGPQVLAEIGKFWWVTHRSIDLLSSQAYEPVGHQPGCHGSGLPAREKKVLKVLNATPTSKNRMVSSDQLLKQSAAKYGQQLGSPCQAVHSDKLGIKTWPDTTR